jgi:hypothetical protein
MKKNLIILIAPALILLSCSSPNSGVDKKYDTIAVENLDELSETIGKLNSCSYTLKTIVSNSKDSENTTIHDVYMRGPDKMHIHSTGGKGQKSYWYNGKHFAYFSYKKNTYDTIIAPNNIIKAINSLHNKYGIDFPAADFFYPTLTDDIINNYDQVLSMDDEIIDNVDCALIEASNDIETVHIWIEKSTYLPYKMIITKNEGVNNFYEAVFSNWKINPTLPDILFEFSPPANATRIKLKVKNQKNS